MAKNVGLQIILTCNVSSDRTERHNLYDEYRLLHGKHARTAFTHELVVSEIKRVSVANE